MLSSLSLFSLNDFPYPELFADSQYPWEALAKIPSFLRDFSSFGIKGMVMEGAFLQNPEEILLEEGAIIEPGAFVAGPCIISKGSVIRHGAYVRGNVIAGHGCVIGHATEIKASILLNAAHAAHFAYVGDSILGEHCNLGAGVKLANLRLDGENIDCHVMGKKISTGRRKLGAVIGDRVQIGCNAVTSPGTVLSPDSCVYPCTHVRGFVSKGAVIKSVK